jgi:hypothetical protein
MVAPYRLLAKIVLTNLWPIARHTELTIEKAQFMYAIVVNIPIDLATYFIDVIQKALCDKESSFPFGV